MPSTPSTEVTRGDAIRGRDRRPAVAGRGRTNRRRYCSHRQRPHPAGRRGAHPPAYAVAGGGQRVVDGVHQGSTGSVPSDAGVRCELRQGSRGWSAHGAPRRRLDRRHRERPATGRPNGSRCRLDLRAAAPHGADARQGRAAARRGGRYSRRPSTGGGGRSDEDGARAARQPRRHGDGDPCPRRGVGRRRRAARRHSVKSFKRLRTHKALRYVSLGLTLVVALLAAAIVSSVTVDLGPIARQKAEIEGSRYIERPMHIGSLKIRLLTGKVLVENLTIDGLHEGDRPFFTARQLAVSLDWMPAIARQPDITITSVERTEWRMLDEKREEANKFPDG